MDGMKGKGEERGKEGIQERKEYGRGRAYLWGGGALACPAFGDEKIVLIFNVKKIC